MDQGVLIDKLHDAIMLSYKIVQQHIHSFFALRVVTAIKEIIVKTMVVRHLKLNKLPIVVGQ